MMDKSMTYALAAVAVIVIIAAIFVVWRPGAGPAATPTPKPMASGTPHASPNYSPPPTPPFIPNPAAKYCTDLNYTLIGPNCTFTDGSSCEQWAFFRGSCGKEFSYCEKQGYALENRSDAVGGFAMQYAVCVFSNGTSECLEQAYQAGSCRPGQCARWAQSEGGCRSTGIGGLPPGPGGLPSGLPNPASMYCRDMNYTVSGENCTFPDGSSCEQWAFFRGKCGQQFSFCGQHGYTLMSRNDSMGGWNSEYAVCSFNGTSECMEQQYQVGICRPGQCRQWNQSLGGCVMGAAPSPAEQSCLSSGGTISTAICCMSAADFPNTCLIGACGCSPDNSHPVRSCDCGSGKCFDGVRCVPAAPAGLPSPPA